LTSSVKLYNYNVTQNETAANSGKRIRGKQTVFKLEKSGKKVRQALTLTVSLANRTRQPKGA